MKRFIYFYFMKNEPQQVGHTAPAHMGYWRGLALPNYHGGPFADRSGGVISFSAQDIEAAQQLIQNDPFMMGQLFEQYWLKEWAVE